MCDEQIICPEHGSAEASSLNVWAQQLSPSGHESYEHALASPAPASPETRGLPHAKSHTIATIPATLSI
jgi:hypothetical protein